MPLGVGAMLGGRLRALSRPYPGRPLQIGSALFMIVAAYQLLIDATNMF